MSLQTDIYIRIDEYFLCYTADMSPLEVYRPNRGMQELANSEKLSLNKWGKILGISPPMVKKAAKKADINLEEGPSVHPNVPSPLQIYVRDFPNLVRGFAAIKPRQDGKVFYPWAHEVDTSAPEFSVTISRDKEVTLVYKAE